jgi:hypothetical protein
VSESGSTDTFTVKLNSQPASNVVISVVSSDTTAATVSASLLTFTNSNWDTAQTVTVAGVVDADADSETVVVALSIASGSAAAYSGGAVGGQNVSVAVTDDD